MTQASEPNRERAVNLRSGQSFQCLLVLLSQAWDLTDDREALAALHELARWIHLRRTHIIRPSSQRKLPW